MRREQDCLQRFRARVTEAKLLDADALAEVDAAVDAAIDAAVAGARAAAVPAADDVLTHVYATYP